MNTSAISTNLPRNTGIVPPWLVTQPAKSDTAAQPAVPTLPATPVSNEARNGVMALTHA